ncbi:hypothetical protein [Sulfitobacter sabulilitoris]|uniref:Sulfotransferase n=1 Tax=Sulfitobacter sabulilitoris TaxID=2562655 RepID=A0A5S3PIH7_9RHOB|nr:hypothetical protein [Sulfitobacter sabulilitoris]TMM54106.1 hypothetical protein FDT80_00430 [Sulfitobacter sabulilitoris]
MQLVLHTGAHFTEEERLMKCLLRNKGDFAKRGVAVPGPGKYRKLLRETLAAMQDTAPSPGAREVLLDAILDDEPADRVILSNAHFFGAPRAAVRQGLIYTEAPKRLAHMTKLFPHDQIELFMAIRNPATFLPAAFDQSPREEMDDFVGGVDPRAIRWSDTLLRIREAVPDIDITVWCNEDTPLIWAQIIRELAGLEHGEKIIGGFDLLSDIMSKEGMLRFRAYLKAHPVMTEVQKRRVIAAFLDKFAIEEEIEEELDMPGWTDALVNDMTEVYDEDVFEIQRIPGVQVIAP